MSLFADKRNKLIHAWLTELKRRSVLGQACPLKDNYLTISQQNYQLQKQQSKLNAKQNFTRPITLVSNGSAAEQVVANNAAFEITFLTCSLFRACLKIGLLKNQSAKVACTVTVTW